MLVVGAEEGAAGRVGSMPKAGIMWSKCIAACLALELEYDKLLKHIKRKHQMLIKFYSVVAVV